MEEIVFQPRVGEEFAPNPAKLFNRFSITSLQLSSIINNVIFSGQ